MSKVIKYWKKNRYYRLFVNTVVTLFPSLIKSPGITDDRDKIGDVIPVMMAWPKDIVKPMVGLVLDTDEYPYWTKFEKFLKQNEIPYDFYHVHNSTWLCDAEKFDIIVWRPRSEPVELEEARRKIYILEKHLHKTCYPSLETILMYEDKIMQYELLKLYNFPQAETIISHNINDISQKIKQCNYPIISKVVPSSGSFGVELISSSKQAMKIARDIFSFSGRRTYWPYLNQKDYVFFQEYKKNEGYDLRVIVVGDNILGYYRDVPAGDFRASGMGLVRHGELPLDAISIARKIAKQFDFIVIAVDMLRDPDTKQLSIIEISSFIQVLGDECCCINDVHGLYSYNEDGTFSFKEGKVWLQELILKEFFERTWLKK